MSAIKDVLGLEGPVRKHVSPVFDNADREVGDVLVGRIARQGSIPEHAEQQHRTGREPETPLAGEYGGR